MEHRSDGVSPDLPRSEGLCGEPTWEKGPAPQGGSWPPRRECASRPGIDVVREQPVPQPPQVPVTTHALEG